MLTLTSQAQLDWLAEHRSPMRDRWVIGYTGHWHAVTEAVLRGMANPAVRIPYRGHRPSIDSLPLP